MKKDFLKYYITGLIIVALICVGIVLLNKNNMHAPTSNTKFYDEYTSYNDKKNSNGKDYPKLSIDKNNLYYYASEDEVKELLNNGTGVLYLGFPTCPWCRNMVSVLNDAAKDYGMAKINYYDIKNTRSTFSFDDNNNLIKTEGTEFYSFLLEKLDKFLTEYGIYDNNNKLVDTGEKRLYAPTVVFIKDGVVKEIIEGTVDSQNDPYILLNETQKNELKNKYLEAFNKLADLCDEKC